jgi:hypothetical protein
MCTSAETTFAWVGTVLINVGFLCLISWGTVSWWFLGCFLSGMYTAFLFGLAVWLETRQRFRDGDYRTFSTTTGADEGITHADASASTVEINNQGPSADTVTGEHNLSTTGTHERIARADANANNVELDTEHHTSTSTETSQQQLPSLASLVYGLAVVAMGVTLFFIPVNLLACRDSRYEPSNGGTWTTDIASLPRGVRQWAKPETDTSIPHSYATFGYLPASGVTVFAGSSSGDSKSKSQNTLWSVNPLSSSNQTAPEAHAEVSYPGAFLDVTANTTCFSAGRSSDSAPYRKVTSVACFDGVDVHWAVDEPGPKRKHNGPFHLIISDGLMWFKESPTDNTQRGMLIFSLDPNSMVQTLHSDPPVKPNKPNKHYCNVKATHRHQAIGTLFLVALPVLVVSILLWQKRNIPSMGLLTYAAATLVFWTSCVSIHPEVMWGDSIAKWWLTVSGVVYLIALVYLLLMVPTVSSRPLVWGINAGAFAFVYGMSVVYMSTIGDHFGSWLLLTLTAFAPVTLLGAATANIFLLLMGASGLFADSVRFAMFLADRGGGSDSVLIVFFVLAIAGVGIGAMGMLLTRNQDHIREVVIGVFSWIETQARKYWCLYASFATEPLQDDVDVDTAPLISVEGA